MRAFGLPQSAADAIARTVFRVVYALALIYWRWAHPRTFGACVGVWCGDRVLVIKNSYKRQHHFPGGSRRGEESWVETASRELREETGMQVATAALEEVFVGTSTEEGKVDQVRFFETAVPQEPPLTIDRREVIWAAFVPAREALRMPLASLARAYLEAALSRRGRP